MSQKAVLSIRNALQRSMAAGRSLEQAEALMRATADLLGADSPERETFDALLDAALAGLAAAKEKP